MVLQQTQQQLDELRRQKVDAEAREAKDADLVKALEQQKEDKKMQLQLEAQQQEVEARESERKAEEERQEAERAAEESRKQRAEAQQKKQEAGGVGSWW